MLIIKTFFIYFTLLSLIVGCKTTVSKECEEEYKRYVSNQREEYRQYEARVNKTVKRFKNCSEAAVPYLLRGGSKISVELLNSNELNTEPMYVNDSLGNSNGFYVLNFHIKNNTKKRIMLDRYYDRFKLKLGSKTIKAKLEYYDIYSYSDDGGYLLSKENPFPSRKLNPGDWLTVTAKLSIANGKYILAEQKKMKFLKTKSEIKTAKLRYTGVYTIGKRKKMKIRFAFHKEPLPDHCKNRDKEYREFQEREKRIREELKQRPISDCVKRVTKRDEERAIRRNPFRNQQF